MKGRCFMACDNAKTVQDAIVGSVTGPQSIRTDAGEVTQRSAMDLITASNYLAGLCAANTRRLGVRYTRLLPDATVHSHLRWPRWQDGGSF